MAEAKRFPRGCVASPHYLASAAGLAVLADGGNAIDAAIATNLTLGVVSPYMCGYGGDLFAIVWNGELHAYNGSGRSASQVSAEAVRAATGSERMPTNGPHAVTIPGAIEGWFTLVERFGTKPFDELAATALRYARDGFPISRPIQEMLRRSASFGPPDEWAAEWRRVYGDAGDTLRQPDLARTIDALCTDGADAYYRGPIGAAIAETLQGFGAFISAEDIAAHTGNDVQTLSTTYRGVEVHELPPNTQGLVALEALNMIEGMDLGAPESTHRHHLLIEAAKLALADRNRYISDPDAMTMDPATLISHEWAEQRAAAIDPTRASTPEPGPAAPGGTIYLCAADRDGMLVSLIQSNYQGFGSGVTVPGWGINLQNRGASFSLDPSHVNVIAPSKRPMHTLMPAFAFRDGAPWLVFGSMGGDGQAQTHLQFLTRVIDDGADVQAAIDAPRWVITPDTWTVAAESRFHTDMLMDLERMGHAVTRLGPYETVMGHAHAIEVAPYGYAAATDPRAEGAALGI